MIKNRTVQLVFQTAYCVLAFIGFINSLGYFRADFNEEFYIYYTNLSNYICMGFMFVCLANTIKSANKKEDGYCETCKTFNFMCLIMILVTFLVYNILLTTDVTVVEYFTSMSNMIMHVILPIMFILNWVLFYEHNKLKWYHPLLCLIIPLCYVAFILIRGAILNGNTETTLYPYFFLNVNELGWKGLFGWIGILLLVFIAIGYLLYGIDNYKVIKAKLSKK